MAAGSPTNASTAAAPPPFQVYLPGERPDENRGPEIIATCVALTAIALVIVSLRIFVRIKFVRFLGADDYLMVLAVVRTLLFRLSFLPFSPAVAGLTD